MSTHNICFCREIRKILCGYPLLSVALVGRHFLLDVALTVKAFCYFFIQEFIRNDPYSAEAFSSAVIEIQRVWRGYRTR